MFNNTTLNQLREMRLTVMAEKFREQSDAGSGEQLDLTSLSFEERFGLLVEAEWLSRRSKRFDRLITQAEFRFPAFLEDIDYQSKQGIAKSEVIRLSTGHYLKKNLNIIVSGPTGVGKTYLVCALGRSACMQGVGVAYLRVPDLFLRLADAHLEGRYDSLRNKLSKIPLLILDDFGLKKFTLEESHEIMELVERRYARASTIISGQLPHAAWLDLFPDPTLAEAILDRIIHNAYRYNITGDSMRKILGERDLENT
ncbi:ATPase AAA [Spirochaetia bacterium]|nr:ATPase AAA [Spirochaetia bacterium]